MMCVKLIVFPTPPSIHCLARAAGGLPMLPAVGCCPAPRSRSPVSEADWESCHVLCVYTCDAPPVGDLGEECTSWGFVSGVFAGLLPRQEVRTG